METNPGIYLILLGLVFLAFGFISLAEDNEVHVGQVWRYTAPDPEKYHAVGVPSVYDFEVLAIDGNQVYYINVDGKLTHHSKYYFRIDSKPLRSEQILNKVPFQ